MWCEIHCSGTTVEPGQVLGLSLLDPDQSVAVFETRTQQGLHQCLETEVHAVVWVQLNHCLPKVDVALNVPYTMCLGSKLAIHWMAALVHQ